MNTSNLVILNFPSTLGGLIFTMAWCWEADDGCPKWQYCVAVVASSCPYLDLATYLTMRRAVVGGGLTTPDKQAPRVQAQPQVGAPGAALLTRVHSLKAQRHR